MADTYPNPTLESPDTPVPGRVEQLRADLAAVGVHDPVNDRERILARLGVLLMVAGPIWVAVEYFVSHSGHNSLQQRDAIIGALFGLALCVVGAALFLRYSGGRLLRLWMARSALVTAQHNADLLDAITRGG